MKKFIKIIAAIMAAAMIAISASVAVSATEYGTSDAIRLDQLKVGDTLRGCIILGTKDDRSKVYLNDDCILLDHWYCVAGEYTVVLIHRSSIGNVYSLIGTDWRKGGGPLQ